MNPHVRLLFSVGQSVGRYVIFSVLFSEHFSEHVYFGLLQKLPEYCFAQDKLFRKQCQQILRIESDSPTIILRKLNIFFW